MKEANNIAILTSGGDAPGMNKYLINFIRYANKQNLNVYCIKNGLLGLYNNEFELANLNNLSLFENLSGTCIFTSRFKEFEQDEKIALIAKQNLLNNHIDALVILGGNGSLQAAIKLMNLSIKIIIIPCSIDNDVDYSQYSIGFDSACNSAVNTIEQLKTTINSHHQIIFNEIMGNKCSDLTIACSLATNADYTITTYNKKNKNELLNIIKTLLNDKQWLCIVISENVYNKQELEEIINFIQTNIEIKIKYHIIGFVQRGANVSSYDKLIATSLAIHTIDKIINNEFNIAIGIKNNTIIDQNLNSLINLNKDKIQKTKILLNKINNESI